MRSRRLAALAVVLPLLALSGCGGDNPKPKPYDPPSTSASPTTSQTPQAESPQAFIRRWVAASTKMQNTGVSTGFRQLGYQCAECDKFATQIEGIYAKGGLVDTEGWKILTIKAKGSGKTGEYDMRVNASPTRYRESKDAPVQHLSGGPSTVLVRLTNRQGSWFVTMYGTEVS